jgi:Xaa-Pro aminopeptidase
MSKRLEYIRKAQEITDQVFSEIIKFIRPGMTEMQVSRQITKLIIKNGGDKKLAFKSLVCSGPRTALFHGPTSNRKIKKGEPVYLDFGAMYRGWCADLTRTFFIGKPLTKYKKLVNIYKLVLIAQQKQIRAVKSGVSAAEIDLLGRNFLKKHKLDKYFIHSTGHGVGQQVHQKPRVSYRSNEILRDGQVITIEPGVYIKGLGGVRIEDLVIVGKRSENLTSSNKKLFFLPIDSE